MSQNSYVVDDMTVGSSYPNYTWRKGGLGPDDNHLYLMIGSAYDEVDVDKNVLLEVDPDSKITAFYQEAKLLNGFSLDDNTLGGTSLKDGTVAASKLVKDIAIEGSVSRLTTAHAIDGLQFDGSKDVTRFVVCTTKADAQVKVVACPAFAKAPGSTAYVMFEQNNAHLTPQLNINDTGVHSIYYNGKLVSSTDIVAGHVYCFVFDGTNYNILNSNAAATGSLIEHGSFFNAGNENIWNYTLVMADAFGKHYSIVKQGTTDTTKTATSQWLNPSKVYVNNSRETINANQTGTEQNSVYLSGPFNLSYNFNLATAENPIVGTKIYLKVVFDKSTGLVKLADQWYATSIPQTDDGFSYLYIGQVCGYQPNTQSNYCLLAYTNDLYIWNETKYESLRDIRGITKVALVNENFTRGSVGKDATSVTQIPVFDSNGIEYNEQGILGYVKQTVVVASGVADNKLSIAVNNPQSTSDNTSTEIGIGYKVATDGSITQYTFAPTPSDGDDSTQIATTEWVRKYVLANFVTKEQAETLYLSKQQYQADIDEAYNRLL